MVSIKNLKLNIALFLVLSAHSGAAFAADVWPIGNLMRQMDAVPAPAPQSAAPIAAPVATPPATAEEMPFVPEQAQPTIAAPLSAPPAEAMAPPQEKLKPAGGLSLQDVLAEAYRSNPDLLAARAELRSVDEEYAQAVAGFRPSAAGEASYISNHADSGSVENGSDPKSLSIDVSQPIYRGGSNKANLDQSLNLIKAQRALLKVREQDVLGAAIVAFMDVRRDLRIVELNMNNEKVLQNQLEASRQRFELGDITRTDVSQSESRLADAVADRITAAGNLKKSRATLERVSGLPAGELQDSRLDIKLPGSLEQALEEADQGNPRIIFSHYNGEAAEALTRSISGELLPQIDLTGGIDRTYDTAGGEDKVDGRTIGIRATIPIFTGGGSTYSRIRQSRQIAQQRHLQERDTARLVREGTIAAWETLVSASAEKEARLAQIEASKTALEGVRMETDFGSRTTLDLLDAEQENLDAQVAFVSADRDHVVAAYALLATAGRLTAENLGLDVPLYDPLKNFQNVKHQWVGAKIGPAE